MKIEELRIEQERLRAWLAEHQAEARSVLFVSISNLERHLDKLIASKGDRVRADKAAQHSQGVLQKLNSGAEL